MRIRLLVVASLMLAVPLFAGETKIYSSYETTRQALVKAAIPDVQKSAAALAAVARAEKQPAIAAHADALAASKDLGSARNGFAVLSEDIVAFRTRAAGQTPVVLYCSMEKKHWLQPTASPVSNPYVDAAMRSCGQVVK